MKRRPFAYLVRQRGLCEYDEICKTKREAVDVAKEGLWWSQQITVTPIHLGKPIKWISKRQSLKRSRVAR